VNCSECKWLTLTWSATRFSYGKRKGPTIRPPRGGGADAVLEKSAPRWKTIAAYPAEAPELVLNKDKYGHSFPSIAYDPAHDTLYLYFFNDKKWPEGVLMKYARSE